MKRSQSRTALPLDDLARALLGALRAGNGRSARCEITKELPDRLREDGAQFRPQDLSLALVKLEDAGCVSRVQTQLGPSYVVANGMAVFDSIDVLCADIAAVIKQHNDEFENEEQLQGWLTGAGIAWDEHSLVLALGQLESMGRVKRPRQDHWREDLPLPGWWVPARVFTE
jgi:hypothetical protein